MSQKQKAGEITNRKVIKRLGIGGLIGLAVLSFFIFFGDVRQVYQIGLSVPPGIIVLAVATVSLGYFFRYLKWSLLLRQSSIYLPWKDNLTIFLMGLSMAITPGKFGELVKSFMLKKRKGFKISHSAPAVMMDRLTDLMAMIFLVALGLLFFPFGLLPFLVITISLLLFFLLLYNKRISLSTILYATSKGKRKAFRFPSLRFYYRLLTLLDKKRLFSSLALSLAAWLLECFALFLLITSFQLELSLLQTIFIFSSGTIIGAFSFLPGGLGAAEGSLTAFFIYFGVEQSLAVTITLLIRLVTLWLGVFIGFALLLFKGKAYINDHSDR